VQNERHIEKLQDLVIEPTTVDDVEYVQEVAEATEAACDSLAFTQALWNLFMDQGLVDYSDKVDYALMENIIDALNGELAAACLFFSEKTFDKVPDMLRVIADQLEKSGDTATPRVVIQGYRRLATRIENTKKNIATAHAVLKQNEEQP
jgi:hypothetical protein